MSKSRTISCHLLILLTLLVSGCASDPTRWQDGVREKIASELDQAADRSESHEVMVPPQISQALLPPMQIRPPQSAPVELEPRFDLTANKTPARSVFMSLVKNTPYSMVLHPDVDGVITLELKNVTVEEALNTLRRVYGYEYQRDGNRFIVLGTGMQTRIFPVSYLNFNRKGHSNTRVSSGELSQNLPGATGTDGGEGGQSSGIQVETNSESNFWKDLKDALDGIVGSEEGRRVVINPQAGLVVVRAMPNELALIENFLGITQESVNRQVILEAKIIEVELNDTFQAGINWSGLGNHYIASQIGGGTLLTGLEKSNSAGAVGNLQPNNFSPVPASTTSAFGGIFSLSIEAQDFTAFIELLQGQGDVHVLSSPRVATVNNQKAVIKVGGDEFFVTGVTNTQQSSGSTTTSMPEVELTPFFSGIALDVTPHIDNKENITLHIHPTVSNVSQRDKSFVISGENFSLPLAFSTIQESDNVVRAQSGQVIIIGGLMKEASTDKNASIPLLGDIPVVGNLFKHQRYTRIKKELVILLKPSIVSGVASWQEAIASSQRRSNDMQHKPMVRE